MCRGTGEMKGWDGGVMGWKDGMEGWDGRMGSKRYLYIEELFVASFFLLPPAVSNGTDRWSPGACLRGWPRT